MYAIPLPPKPRSRNDALGNRGVNAQGENRKIVSLGGPPGNVVKAKLNIGLKNSRVKRAEVLDANFLKTDEIKIANGRFSCAG